MIGTRPVLLFAIVALFGCGDQTGPTDGTAVVSLSSPNTDDGAVIVTVRGPGLKSIQTSDSGHRLFSRVVGQAAVTEAHIMVVGDLTSGPLFTLTVSRREPLSAYTATLEQVATRSDSQRTNLSGYKATVTAAP